MSSSFVEHVNGLNEEIESKVVLQEQAKAVIEDLMRKLDEFIQGEACYIGHKNDAIDMRLANYINLLPKNELKILFLRQEEGVYKYGSKKVCLKIDKGDQILARTGGGYVTIDDFIDKHSALEQKLMIKKRSLNPTSIAPKSVNKALNRSKSP